MRELILRYTEEEDENTEAILSVLREAEEEGDLDFVFTATVTGTAGED